MTAIPCQKCGDDLYFNGTLTCVAWVHPQNDPEGKARADLILECDECGTRLNAFVPFDAFTPIEGT